MSIVNYLQEVIETINEEVIGIDNMLIDSGRNSSSSSSSSSSSNNNNNYNNNNQSKENEFTQYYEHIQRIKECSIKSKLVINKIIENEEKSRYLLSKLTDYGDLVKRIERLTSAIDELEYKIAVKDFDFRTIHNVLDIIDNEIFETQAFHGIQAFRELKKRVSKSKNCLKKEIFRRYREIGLWAEIPMNSTGRQIDSSSRASMLLDSLRSANIVIDILGNEVKMELLETLVQSQLLPYQTRSGYEGGDLYGLDKDKLEQSKEELYKILVSASSPHMQRVMSSEWNISFFLYITFCKQTSEHLRDLLNKEVKKLYTPPVITALNSPNGGSNGINDSTKGTINRKQSIKITHISSSDVDGSNQSKKGFPGSNALGKVTGGIGTVAGAVAGTVVDTVGTVANGVVAVGTNVTSTIGLGASSHSHTSSIDYEPDFNRLTEHGNFIVSILKTIIAIEQEMHKMFDDGVFALNNNGIEYDPQTLTMILKQDNEQDGYNNYNSNYNSSNNNNNNNNYNYGNNDSRRRSNRNTYQTQYRCYLMSCVFDDYLDPFVQTERITMQNLITTLVNEDMKIIKGDEPTTPETNQTTSSSSSSSNSSGGFPMKNPFKSSKSQSNTVGSGNSSSSLSSTTNNHSYQSSSSLRLLQQNDSEFDLINYTASCQTIFNSSEQLYQAIRSSLLKCTSFSSGKPLICLINEYKVCFQIYAEILRNTLCPSIPINSQKIGKRKSFEQSLSDEILTCRTIITAEKLITLLPQIQNEIQSKISSNMYILYSVVTPSSNDLDMSPQVELFEDVISYSIDILVGSILNSCSSCYQIFAAIPWSRVTSVGDCSPYVNILSQILSTIIPKFRKVLTWKYFEVLCYRFNCDFLDYFLALIMGLKKICIIGAEQLLLDMNEIKPLILKLHYICLPIKSIERQTMKMTEKYHEIINKKLKLIEIVLKLLCSDDDQIEENFYIMWPDGQENDLNVIKSLKIPRVQTTPHGNNDGHEGGQNDSYEKGSHSNQNNNNNNNNNNSNNNVKITSSDSNFNNNGNSNKTESGNIFKDNKLTHGIDNAVASIDNAMENFKLKATNFTDKLKIGKKQNESK